MVTIFYSDNGTSSFDDVLSIVSCDNRNIHHTVLDTAVRRSVSIISPSITWHSLSGRRSSVLYTFAGWRFGVKFMVGTKTRGGRTTDCFQSVRSARREHNSAW